MFGPDFFPTPRALADQMLAPLNLKGATVLEPSAGKGDLARACLAHGAAEILVCESSRELRAALLATNPARLIGCDFMDISGDAISHIDAIVMNPPFSAADRHILHAWKVAPAGCNVVALCNWETYRSAYSSTRRELRQLIDDYGSIENVGSAFTTAERTTEVEVGLVRLYKPGIPGAADEFEGFFLGPDEVEAEGEGLIPYRLTRDAVNRYVEACRIFDEQLEAGVRLNNVLTGFYAPKGTGVALIVTENGQARTRQQFRNDLQKQAWMWLFKKLDMNKFATTGLRSDINKFVEQQTAVPFTERNIYRMVEIVLGTHEQRIDRAIEEVFDNLTRHTHENRYAVPGWKTNSGYLFGKKFIIPYLSEPDWSGGTVSVNYGGSRESVMDLIRALVPITGRDWEEVSDPPNGLSRLEPGVWHEWGFFEFKVHKKGTGHFRFRDLDDWAILNRRIGKIKGMVLPERLH